MVGTPRSGKMSRDIRSTARKPTNATAMTIVKSEIGRRNANDTRFIVRPQPALPRPDDRARLDGAIENHRDISQKCSSYSVHMLNPPEVRRRRAVSSTWMASRLGMPRGLQAPTVHD